MINSWLSFIYCKLTVLAYVLYSTMSLSFHSLISMSKFFTSEINWNYYFDLNNFLTLSLDVVSEQQYRDEEKEE